MTENPIVIIGAGHAGVHAAVRLAESKWPGRILLIEAGDSIPYERPPLSKDVLKAGSEPNFPLLRKQQYFADKGIDLTSGRSVVAVDKSARTVRLDDRSVVPYHRLILATGSRARALPVPGGDAPGVLVLKTKEDALSVKTGLKAGNRVVIIGAGYIGMEVAAAAVDAGSDTMILEAQDGVMSRVTSRDVAGYFESLHRSHGARFAFGASVVAIRESHGALEVVCADGTTYPADLVLVGIGVVPNQELAAAAGLDCSDGILVDGNGVTSDPFIYAAGDATRFTCPREHVSQRLECVQNAMSQADAVVNHIMGISAAKTEIPWFWTVQHGVRLQTAGVRDISDETILRGEPADGRFSVLYLRNGRLAAIDTVHALKDFVAGKKLIASKALIDSALAVDPEIPLAQAEASSDLVEMKVK